MTAYRYSDLYNLVVKDQAKEAYNNGYITNRSYSKILQAHPVLLYSPNIFVQIGLGLLTIFIIIAVFGLLLLLLNLNSGLAGLTIFTGIACYAVLEFLTRSKNHYNSGVDNLLMIAVPLLIITGINMEVNNAERLLSFLFCAICFWQAIRFTDRLMALGAAIGLLFFTFNLYVNLGEWTIATFPIVIISVSAAMYFVAKKIATKDNQLIYKSCWFTAEAASLIAIYAGGNIFMVDAIANETYLLQQDSPVHLGWLFWSWTFAVPVVYFLLGIKNKDLLLLRLGIIFIAASILTYRHYHAILPLEIALTIAGFILVGLVYWLMQYLKKPKLGFVFAEEQSEPGFEDFEALAIGETFGDEPIPLEESRFGGGSFGGAGAGSHY